MTGTAVRPSSSVLDTTHRPDTDRPSRPTLVQWLRRPLVACLVLFAVYASCSIVLNDPRGTLGTDTGGKLATLHVMDHAGSLVPDVGYWTQADTKGDLHPLFYTFRVDGKWVNVTTLPMVYLAYPLYELGGDRGVLLIPMFGSVLCALAARALARRLGHSTGWTAFWVMGLLSPVAIYALDFWEHSLGLALMLWAVVWLVRMVAEGGRSRDAFVAGVLFGAAATMRTEALVYLAVCAGIACLVRLWRIRRLVPVLLDGVAVLVGAAIPLVANELLERAALGGTIRASRAAGTAAGAAGSVSVRVSEAFTTLVGMNRFDGTADYLLGAIIVGCLVAAVLLLTRGASSSTLAVAALVIVVLLYLGRAASGLGFVPGLLTASPFAAVGLVIGWRRELRIVTAMAVAALPLVWAFQYSGGAVPQWGARYALLSGALLLVVATVALEGQALAVLATAVVASFVTAFGVAWLSTRSHLVASGMETIVRRHDAALISGDAHVLREGGAFYDASRHWLTTTDARQRKHAVDIVERAGDRELAYVVYEGSPMPRALGDFRRTSVQRVEFLKPGLFLVIGTYRRP